MISLVLIFLAAIPKAIMDLSSEGNLPWDPEFWHKNVSWKNKWKNGDPLQGERFWGSSRWFVLVSDGWHLMQFGFLGLMFLAIICYEKVGPWWADLIVMRLVFGGVFEFCHRKLFRK